MVLAEVPVCKGKQGSKRKTGMGRGRTPALSAKGTRAITRPRIDARGGWRRS